MLFKTYDFWVGVGVELLHTFLFMQIIIERAQLCLPVTQYHIKEIIFLDERFQSKRELV